MFNKFIMDLTEKKGKENNSFLFQKRNEKLSNYLKRLLKYFLTVKRKVK